MIWKGAGIPGRVKAEHFAAAAERLGCKPAAIRAVWEVEAAGRCFLDDGSLVRRFEPHHFPRELWGALDFEPKPGEAAWRASLRLSTERMFMRAAALDLPAALRASSWGAPQIMGFNHADAGFDSPSEMVRHMAAGADRQLGAFVQLVEGWGLDSALRAQDWTAFARRYNGSGQVAVYASRMESAFRRHSGEASPVVLRVGDRGPAVRRLQAALGQAVDGAFGPETLAAVEVHQREAGLAVDGVVGTKTWESLATKAPAQPSRLEQVRKTAEDAGVAATAVGTAGAALRGAVPEEFVPWIIVGGLAVGAIYLITRRR